MSTNQAHAEDPVVAEVRAIRREMWAEAGGTIEGFLRLLARERASGAGSRVPGGRRALGQSRRRRQRPKKAK
ncbi:MAG: hypothetical protein AMXMBFR47_41790 [Planctomycetota bacterium]